MKKLAATTLALLAVLGMVQPMMAGYANIPDLQMGTLEKYMNDADVVVMGTIVEGKVLQAEGIYVNPDRSDNGMPTPYRVEFTLKVTESFKGKPDKEIRATATLFNRFLATEALTTKDQKVVLFLKGDKVMHGTLTTGPKCPISHRVADTDKDELLKAIREHVKNK